MKIAIVGIGYVGAVCAACFAELGHEIVTTDISQKKVDAVNKGVSPIKEPFINELIEKYVDLGKISATISLDDAVDNADCVMVCVGTPSQDNGAVDLTQINQISSRIVEVISGSDKNTIIMFRSTVPPGTHERLISSALEGSDADKIKVVFNPEFLREGSSYRDFLDYPAVVLSPVYGNFKEGELQEFAEGLYDGVKINFHEVSIRTGEMIKYMNNCFHALKVAFANEMGRMAKSMGVDNKPLFDLFLDDKKLNVSEAYLRPGFAFGGSCLPKELMALEKLSVEFGENLPLLASVMVSNNVHIDKALDEISALKPKKVGFLGISFKTKTDDLRESPYCKLAANVMDKGIEAYFHDVNISEEILNGANLKYFEKYFPQKWAAKIADMKQLIETVDVIVLCHNDKGYKEALSQLDSQGHIVDLTGGFDSEQVRKIV